MFGSAQRRPLARFQPLRVGGAEHRLRRDAEQRCHAGVDVHVAPAGDLLHRHQRIDAVQRLQHRPGKRTLPAVQGDDQAVERSGRVWWRCDCHVEAGVQLLCGASVWRVGPEPILVHGVSLGKPTIESGPA